MSRQKNVRIFVGDFETTTYSGQEFTEVWASAAVELFKEDATVYHSIDDTYAFLKSLNTNVIIYYHNLKFDGNFWLDFLIRKLGYKQAVRQLTDNEFEVQWKEDKYMDNRTFKYLISDMGQWYDIKIKVNDKFIEIRDSLKLLPFSVKEIGKSFGTKHNKLEMEYEGFRYAGCVITPEEEQYIKNDVFVVKEALEIMYKQGHNKLTIGACCFAEYKQIIGKKLYEAWFPNLYEIPLDKEIYNATSAGEYIRKSYKGGWCYLAKSKEQKKYKNGITVDVNSLYPSMMSKESGNHYPLGKPHFWVGEIPEIAQINCRYFFVTIKCRFYIKDGYLPFIQIKNNWCYKSTESLETSDIRDKEGKYHKWYQDFDGTIKPAKVILTLTMTDYYLMLEHYNVEEIEYLHGCWFESRIGVFDEYIEKYKQIKLKSTGAIRTLAKLFLNNLYGKMATNTNSSFKYVFLKDDNVLGFTRVSEHDKTPGFIACGSAITSYSRNFTIRAAQKNFYGSDKRGFIYADTDSIHCDLTEGELKGVKLHDSNFCCWKIEKHWSLGWFVRQKTYIEKEGDEYDIKCAGMNQKCKDVFMKELQTGNKKLEDFNIGLKIQGKLVPKRILGGVVLKETTFEMR